MNVLPELSEPPTLRRVPYPRQSPKDIDSNESLKIMTIKVIKKVTRGATINALFVIKSNM